jgi:hypothetical protein
MHNSIPSTEEEYLNLRRKDTGLKAFFRFLCLNNYNEELDEIEKLLNDITIYVNDYYSFKKDKDNKTINIQNFISEEECIKRKNDLEEKVNNILTNNKFSSNIYDLALYYIRAHLSINESLYKTIRYK